MVSSKSSDTQLNSVTLSDGMNFEWPGPFTLDNKSSRRVNWRPNQMGVLKQKLDLGIRLDDGRRTPEDDKKVVHNRRNRSRSTLRQGLSLSASSTSSMKAEASQTSGGTRTYRRPKPYITKTLYDTG